MKKDIELMTKVELIEYAKKCRYMLGKLNAEAEAVRQENAALHIMVKKLERNLKSERQVV